MARADTNAVNAAAHHMGVNDLVYIEYLDGGTSIGVSGYYRRENGHHSIIVATELSPRAMSQTIYHELEHARQCEHEFNGDGASYHSRVVADAFAAIGGDEPITHWEARARQAETLDDQVRLCYNDEGGY